MNLTLVKKITEARETKTFIFESSEKFEWLPGQYIYITLPKLNYPDERGETRHFTISSSPTEKRIQITTRIRENSGYKRTLDELSVETVCEGKGPQGTFVFTNDNDMVTNRVFLAGGIGITPFRSYIKYCVDKGIKTPIHLIYSNSDSNFVFKKDLDQWQKENKFLKVTYFDTSVSGHLDSKALSNLVEIDLKSNIYYAVGPNSFVNAMEEVLEKLEVPDDNIKTEKFTGY